VGTVDGVLFRDGQIILEIDGMELSLDDVVEIGPSKDPSQPLASLKGLLAQEVEMKS